MTHVALYDKSGQEQKKSLLSNASIKRTENTFFLNLNYCKTHLYHSSIDFWSEYGQDDHFLMLCVDPVDFSFFLYIDR